MSKKKFLDNLWKYSSLIVLISLIGTIPLYIIVINFENNNPIEDNNVIIPAKDLSTKRTRVIKKHETLSYDNYISGTNITDFSIFLVTFSVYHKFGVDFPTLFDY